MPRAAQAGVNPAARLNFFHHNVSNLFLCRYDVPVATTEYEHRVHQIAVNLRFPIGTAGIQNSDVF
jgi:hypothetical protein